MKKCSKCKRSKPLDAFNAKTSAPDGKQYECRACSRAGRRESHLRTQYGLTSLAYDELLMSQGDACAICKREPKGKHLAVDHDHATNAVRGLLCDQCNHVLGKVEDRAEWLRNAADYLDAFAFHAV